MQITKTKWFLPLFAVALGVVIFAAQWIGGRPGRRPRLARDHVGVRSPRALRRPERDDPGLRGDGRDERFREIDIHATAFAGLAVITAIIAAFLVEVARGHTGAPYSWLGAIAGLAYVAAVVVFRLKG